MGKRKAKATSKKRLALGLGDVMKAIQTLVFNLALEPVGWQAKNWFAYQRQFREQLQMQQRANYPDAKLFSGNVEITQLSFILPSAGKPATPPDHLTQAHIWAMSGILYHRTAQVTHVRISEMLYGDAPGIVIVITGEIDMSQPLPDMPDDWHVEMMDVEIYPRTQPKIYRRMAQ
jgi:hypothetical protein